MDDLQLEGKALEKNLNELAFINRYLGGNDVVLNALEKIVRQHPHKKSWTIGDMGSGGGDLLRVMAQWFRKKGLEARLVGVDANAFMIDFAQKRGENYPEISFQQANVFEGDFDAEQFDIVVFSLFCHHFKNEQLVQLWAAAQRKANVAVVVNDLHRHWLAWASIWVLTRLFRGSYLVQHDAPLSVLRAFKRRELKQLLDQAGIHSFQLQWKWAFRFQLIYDGGKEDGNSHF